MLLDGLILAGWEVRSDLKIPWAQKNGRRLWFKPQAIYFGPSKDFSDARSISSDMREFTTVDDLLRTVARW